MEGVGRNPECMVLDLHLTVPRTQCPSARKLQHISPGKKKPPRAQPTAANDRWDGTPRGGASHTGQCMMARRRLGRPLASSLAASSASLVAKALVVAVLIEVDGHYY